ncbi:MAG: SDR family oxidoreductase [Bacteroidales bacterium]|jgi:NAD(P)-dependent dehydrogenase (short-subunit alcohol dehydrogenase family)|nr:SDR family oxidoreductase [Bacteroidales bacterium]
MNIVITGSSSGIGREVALRLSDDPKHRIYAIARGIKSLKSLSGASSHDNIIAVPMDIASGKSSLRELKNRLKREIGRLDILINNAGHLVNKPFEDHSESDIASSLTVNFVSAAMLTAELLPLMERGSHVINIGSMGGFQGSLKFPGLSWYSATKGALAILTECLAAEYSERGISFNCLCPGAVQTEMFSRAFPGFTAPVSAADMASFIADFAVNGNRFFNGKILPVALSAP